MRDHAALSQPADACSCSAAQLSSADLPTLRRRGAHPAWDRYLEAVYGDDVRYPVRLSDFEWFYRCDCRTTDRHCNGSTAHCDVSSGWKSSCLRESAPLSALPRIWFSAPDKPMCTSSYREAFVGLHVAEHVALNPSWRNWPNPEKRLARYGVWLYPRPLPTCLPSDTWVEVIRVREGYESGTPFTWFYHAPGSGVWLNTGRTTCIAEAQRDSLQFSGDPSHVASAALLAERGFAQGKRIDTHLSKKARGNLEATRARLDTLQRNGPFGNMLEIVDVRPEAAQNCGLAGCSCTGTLRAGWNASRPCRCDARRVVANCAG